MRNILMLSVGIANAQNSESNSGNLMECSFRESMSASFGYSSTFKIDGALTAIDPQSKNPFYDLNSPANVSIDHSGSTNFPGRHVGDTTANVNNHPWGNSILVDVTSTASTGDLAFRILVMTGGKNGIYPAYKMSSINSDALPGECKILDARLVSKNQ